MIKEQYYFIYWYKINFISYCQSNSTQIRMQNSARKNYHNFFNVISVILCSFEIVINLFYSGLAHLKSTTCVRILDLQQSSTRRYNKTTSPTTISCIVHSVVDVVRDGF